MSISTAVLKDPMTEENPRARSRKMIEDLLKERQQVLVLYWELSKLDLGTVDQVALQTLEDFQEILVDYIAAGHFGLYERIAEGNERRQAVLETAQQIYPEIARSTDVVVEFSERYERPEQAVIESKLAGDLSVLGEAMSTRIELEDQLIVAMLGERFEIPAHSRPN